MAERYTDCICVDCLNEIGEQFPEPGIAWLRINT
jgi:hypothetical protein